MIVSPVLNWSVRVSLEERAGRAGAAGELERRSSGLVSGGPIRLAVRTGPAAGAAAAGEPEAASARRVRRSVGTTTCSWPGS